MGSTVTIIKFVQDYRENDQIKYAAGSYYPATTETIWCAESGIAQAIEVIADDAEIAVALRNVANAERIADDAETALQAAIEALASAKERASQYAATLAAQKFQAALKTQSVPVAASVIFASDKA